MWLDGDHITQAREVRNQLWIISVPVVDFHEDNNPLDKRWKWTVRQNLWCILHEAATVRGYASVFRRVACDPDAVKISQYDSVLIRSESGPSPDASRLVLEKWQSVTASGWWRRWYRTVRMPEVGVSVFRSSEVVCLTGSETCLCLCGFGSISGRLSLRLLGGLSVITFSDICPLNGFTSGFVRHSKEVRQFHIRFCHMGGVLCITHGSG